MKTLIWISAATLVGGIATGLALAQGGPDEAALAQKCRAFAPAAAIGATSASAQWVAADAKAGTPAHCQVSGSLSPVAGSKIGVVYRLPAQWNGKLVGLGGSGWAGSLRPEVAGPALAAGYATAQTDGGHASTTVWDNSWASDPVAADDFGWRAVHEMTVAGKKALSAYYGKDAVRAYFQGCSTGGRQALMEAQRFPGDYNAIIAGAPVYTLQVQTSQLMRSNGFEAPGAGLDDAHLALVNKAVLAACDANDGQADGLIDEPLTCHWDPAVLACKPGQAAAECLSSAQVEALDTAYSGQRAPDGSWAQWPLSRGGELMWKPFIAVDGTKAAGTDGGFATLGPVLYGDRKVDFDHLTPAEVVAARASPFAKLYEAKDPDLLEFFARGGKLLMYQGDYDSGPSPVGASDYAAAVAKRTPKGAATNLRLFLMPGMGHCGGGPGPDKVDWLAALDGWVKTGKAPDQLVATKQGSPLTRALCASPKVARYKGAGDANDPAAYTCVPRSRV